MDPYIIQLPNDPTKSTYKRFTLYSVTGTKREYGFRFRYSSREDCWYIDVELSGELLVGGIRCVPMAYIMRHYTYNALIPWGPVQVWNFTDPEAEPKAGELGKNAFVIQVLIPPEV